MGALEQVMLGSADVQFFPAWISHQEADALFSSLLERLPLKQESIVVAGGSRSLPQTLPRLAHRSMDKPNSGCPSSLKVASGVTRHHQGDFARPQAAVS